MNKTSDTGRFDFWRVRLYGQRTRCITRTTAGSGHTSSAPLTSDSVVTGLPTGRPPKTWNTWKRWPDDIILTFWALKSDRNCGRRSSARGEIVCRTSLKMKRREWAYARERGKHTPGPRVCVRQLPLVNENEWRRILHAISQPPPCLSDSLEGRRHWARYYWLQFSFFFSPIIMPPPLRVGGVKRWCASDVWRLSVWRMSRTSSLSREQRGLGRLKLAQM